MSSDICIVCKSKIEMQIFKATGVCSENCRKVRDGESKIVEVQISPNGKPGKR